MNNNSIVSKRHNDDCLPCRLVTGFGLLGIGAYVYFQAKSRPKTGKTIMYIIASGFGGIGAARLLNIYPVND